MNMEEEKEKGAYLVIFQELPDSVIGNVIVIVTYYRVPWK